ncbi:hypothetical protein DMUE_1026 [Dictyocoela muelleri]|nr:hypothetical protein DMUE_1026 [Dictyocoela muelleri]
MIERGTRKCLLFPVENRTSETLLSIISIHVRPGTIIISDKWRSYAALRDNPNYSHLTVNHSYNFVSPDDSTINTQNIENLWLHVKRKFKLQYDTKRNMLEGYLYEFMFKNMFPIKNERFNQFLISLGKL